ncbi:MAG: hypothetical protein AAFN00_19860 [Cyanobacteria bacterium J06558_2]
MGETNLSLIELSLNAALPNLGFSLFIIYIHGFEPSGVAHTNFTPILRKKADFKFYCE